MKEALFYKQMSEGDRVKCMLCPRFCVIAEGSSGFCGAGEIRKGVLYARYYGKTCSVGVEASLSVL